MKHADGDASPNGLNDMPGEVGCAPTTFDNPDVRGLIDGVDAILWEAEWPSWRYTFVSQRAETLLGYPLQRWLTESHFWMNHLHPEDRERAIAHALGNTECGRDHVQEFRMLCADGGELWLRETVRLIRDSSQRCYKLRGTMVDITAQRRSERALRLSEQRFRALYDEQPVMLFSLSPMGLIESVNEFGAHQLGYEVNELVEVRAEDLHPPSERRAVQRHLARCFKRPEHVYRWQSCLLDKSGKPVWTRVSARAVSQLDGRTTLLLLCEDMSRARERSRELAHRSSHDSLTGLLNRAWFERRVQRALYSAYEYGAEHVLGVLDLNQFKILNHRLGHAAGDELLRMLGELLTDGTRPTDTIARIGGDEFGLLFENCTLERARALASELLTAISAQDFEWADETMHLSASIGLVPLNANSDSVAELVSTAETACRAAGERGRSRIHVSQADDREIAERQREMEWAARLQTALQEDRFELHYQPIASLRDGDDTARHYELLLRLRTEDDQLVTPDRFLPAAERYQLLPEIDRWVVAQALQWLDSRPDAQVAHEMCSINLSGPSLVDPEFLSFVLERLSGTRNIGRAVCFEITETSIIDNLTRAMHCVRALRRAGCRFALDDFGSGVSSFAYLKSLPVDFIKIDGLFVRNIADDPEELRFLRLINEIGQVTGKRTVAEFVESEAILSKLREIGVDYAQGFHISRPQPIGHYVARAESSCPANVAVFAHKRRNRPAHRV